MIIHNPDEYIYELADTIQVLSKDSISSSFILLLYDIYKHLKLDPDKRGDE